jgi:hypothetical protein
MNTSLGKPLPCWTALVLGFLVSSLPNMLVAETSHAQVAFRMTTVNEQPPSSPPDEIRFIDLSSEELDNQDTSLVHDVKPIVIPESESPVELALGEEIVVDPLSTSEVGFGDWLGYNSTASDTTWVAAGHDLGMFSLQSYPTLEITENSGIVTGLGFHFLSGPSGLSDMPPRLFDFQLAYQTREVRNDHFMLDLKMGVGAFSDFEGRSGEGVRFPGHAVAYYEVDPWLVTVLGVEVLDRDDISVLPVAGFVLRATDAVLVECVFPKPKIQWQVNPDCVIYANGELGGGTWAIERVDNTDDNVTYRDLRLAFGIIKSHDSSESVLEFGYAFDRSLEYRSDRGNYKPDNAFMLRIRSHY